MTAAPSQSLDLYTVFHLNLGFSSVPSDHYPLVVKRCYWPLLDWAGNDLARFGIEFPADTLRIIQETDPAWVARLIELEAQKKIEVVGSGLVQAISPLLPADVNRWNFKLGMEQYRKRLGKTPAVAYINEQSYSGSLIRLYKEAGFETVVFDWNNANKYAGQGQYLSYMSPLVVGNDGSRLRLLWNNSFGFQYLQRHIHGDIELAEYMGYLSAQVAQGHGGAFCFYGSDIEMLDYRPGDADALYGLLEDRKEHRRFEGLLTHLRQFGHFRWLLPSEVVKQHSVASEVRLETPERPIPTKKQETYNVTRWALGGRQNPKTNTLCFRAYQQLKEAEGALAAEARTELWSKLCLAWASDFRTYTTEEKFLESQVRVGGLITELGRHAKPGRSAPAAASTAAAFKVSQTDGRLTVGTKDCEVTLKIRRGTICSLRFPGFNPEPVIGLVPQGSYDDIAYGVDYTSGHAVVERPGAFRYTDRERTTLVSHGPSSQGEAGYAVVFKHVSPFVTIWKTYWLAAAGPLLRVRYHFHFNDLPTSRIRLGILTAKPAAFDRSSLWYATHNGGDALERFPLANSPAFDAGDPLGFGVSSSFCLGATAGEVQFGDRRMGVRIQTDKAEQYSVPLVAFAPLGNSFLFRLSHSIGEWDDTANTLWRGHTKVNLAISPIEGWTPAT